MMRSLPLSRANDVIASALAVDSASSNDCSSVRHRLSGEARARLHASLQHALEIILSAGRSALSERSSNLLDEDNEDNEISMPADVYTGYAGLALLFLHVHQQQPDRLLEGQSCGHWAVHFIWAALRRVSQEHRHIGFLSSAAGVNAVAAAVFHSMRMESECKVALQNLLDLVPLVNDQHVASGLLYGRAGLLYAMLFVRHHVPSSKEIFNHQKIADVVNGIFLDAQRCGSDLNRGNDAPLIWKWHHKIYLGAAHGMAGILTVLMHPDALMACETSDSGMARPQRMQATIDFLLATRPSGYAKEVATSQIIPAPTTSILFENDFATADERYLRWNFPSSIELCEDPTNSKKFGRFLVHHRHAEEDLVQFCHGAPGMIPMLLRAREQLAKFAPLSSSPSSSSEAADTSNFATLCIPSNEGKTTLSSAGHIDIEDPYLQAAIQAGRTTWEHGLLRKGPGMCHGLAGNAAAMLELWAAGAGMEWFERAVRFMLVAADWHGMQERKEAREPDHPWSLFEGLAGAAYVWTTLLALDEGKPVSPRFPCLSDV